jgi:hypothetical protein
MAMIYLYAERDGRCPVMEWLRELERHNPAAVDVCLARVRLLAVMGHELRRPHADLLRDGIYELRARVGRVNYRLLYFFHGRGIAIVAHGITKEQEVPDIEIDRAIERKRRYEQSPETHRQVFA